MSPLIQRQYLHGSQSTFSKWIMKKGRGGAAASPLSVDLSHYVFHNSPPRTEPTLPLVTTPKV
jgi:hypothetical protein